jgi:transposase
MITIPAGLRVLIATKPVDFRKGADGLAALVRETLGDDPFSGAIYVFRSKRTDRVKMLAWDCTGLVLLWNYARSYYTSFSFGLGFWFRWHFEGGSSIDEAVPSAALLARRVRFGDLVQVIVHIV